MKFRMLLLLVLVTLLTIGLNAQADLSETFTSSTGLTFEHPEGYTVIEQDGGDNLAIQEEGTESGFLLTIGDTAIENLDGDLDSTEGIFNALAESFEAQNGEAFNEDELTIFEINGEDAFFQLFVVEDFDASVLVFETQDSELAIMVGLILDLDALEEDNLMVRIAETVRREDAPETDTDEDDEESGEARPLLIDEMPEGLLIIYTESGYSEIAYPDTMAPLDVGSEIQTTAVLQYTDDLFTVITVTDLGQNTFFDLDLLKENFVAIIAQSAGDDAFDVDESFEEVELEDGTTAEYYEFEGDLNLIVYIVMLDDDRFGIVQAMGSGRDFPDTIGDDLYAMASSFVVSDFTVDDVETDPDDEAAVEPEFDGDTVTINPDDVDVEEVECGAIAISVLTSANEEAFVVCPAGCGDGAVWGTDIYTSDSAICTAAIHAGAITTDGGLILIRLEDGQESYEGTERNDVTTRDWGSWGESFSIFRVIEEE